MIEPGRERIEELAEEIWALGEMGENSFERVTGGSKLADAGTVLEKMIAEGLGRISDGLVLLTPGGETIARTVIRRHRLAEILFSQVMEIREELSDSTACELEHILSAEVTDSVCTFLGHPPHCPHGKPIPRGDCCLLFKKEVAPLVVPLPDLGIGESGRIVFMAPEAKSSLDRVAALGLIPGAIVRLRQRHPAIVLDVDETMVALDHQVAASLFVRPIAVRRLGGTDGADSSSSGRVL